ncbi:MULTISPECIES: LysM peptidoglycan-binding domain-containing protein [Marichromatium]|uniref:LysM domain-containing protein n=1 Tax=Marichromatium gracile TaxID=1048 RepID=A0A4R4A6D2_MARGR|nr:MULTISPECIES: LysM peptidoglycan-binding domain-containing protein [Marichromatium]MBO8086249.1 LysM peptidoglycan-binding domain-containing protein [Marichromatium sp.]MBK1708724.1 peptidoglycan-binding protein [Marichromatium gracile]RNE91034.1 LysM peptidoglycan-binding domain-containing protein [Marichromatium sp. AB31]RNE93809.1 LysM peptidoglycan-binding domain-containing protein [Marichromatium sp. AB32]TCW34337.1 LysM domain-containing protein [Marichromatium gracile]
MRAPRSLRVLAPLLLVLLVPAPTRAEVTLAPDAPARYVVRSGDTLWDIAGRFLRDPWRWHALWRANPGITNPDLIYPGDLLELVEVNGAAQLQLTRGGGDRTLGYQDGMRVVKRSPQARVTSLEDAVPVIPIASIAPFLTQPLVADSDQVERAPYVVGFPDEHLVVGTFDSIYVRRLAQTDSSRYQVVRPGKALRDPDSNELLGYEVEFVATAALERPGDPAKLRIARAEREVAIGDRVIPAEQERSLENFYPEPGPAGVRGRILSVLKGVSQIGQFDVVILNKGERDGIEAGHVFEVFIGGETAPDQVRRGGFDWNWRDDSPLDSDFWFGDFSFEGWRADPPGEDGMPLHADMRRDRDTYLRPYERAGVLMVFRVFDRVSFALVLEAYRAMAVGDRVAPPPA